MARLLALLEPRVVVGDGLLGEDGRLRVHHARHEREQRRLLRRALLGDRLALRLRRRVHRRHVGRVGELKAPAPTLDRRQPAQPHRPRASRHAARLGARLRGQRRRHERWRRAPYARLRWLRAKDGEVGAVKRTHLRNTLDMAFAAGHSATLGLKVHIRLPPSCRPTHARSASRLAQESCWLPMALRCTPSPT